MDYRKYSFSLAEYVKYILFGSLLISFLTYFFYKSWKVVLASQLMIPLFLKYVNTNLLAKRKKKLADEFSETLYSVSTNLMAGYSIENAFTESRKDIVRFYGEKSLMATEIMRIKEGLSVNVNIEDLIEDLGKRSGVEDIITFSEVFKIAKRNGGNIKEVFYESASTIREKMRIEREIDVIVSEKTFELRIMEVIPFFIMAYVSFTSPGYFNVLYHNIRGMLAMTVCLIIFILSVLLGKKIVNVSV